MVRVYRSHIAEVAFHRHRLRPAHQPGQEVIADITRRRVADLIEYARMEGIHPGIHKIGNRLARLLREPDDRPGRVEFHNTPG